MAVEESERYEGPLHQAAYLLNRCVAVDNHLWRVGLGRFSVMPEPRSRKVYYDAPQFNLPFEAAVRSVAGVVHQATAGITMDSLMAQQSDRRLMQPRDAQGRFVSEEPNRQVPLSMSLPPVRKRTPKRRR